MTIDYVSLVCVVFMGTFFGKGESFGNLVFSNFRQSFLNNFNLPTACLLLREREREKSLGQEKGNSLFIGIRTWIRTHVYITLSGAELST